MKLDLKIDLTDKRVIICATCVIVVLIGICIYSKRSTMINNTKSVSMPPTPSKLPEKKETKEEDKNKQMVMYGRDSCPWCAKQKTEMGDEMKNVRYINCEKTPDECRKAQISALPTWVINGKKFEGFMPKDKVLSKLN